MLSHAPPTPYLLRPERLTAYTFLPIEAQFPRLHETVVRANNTVEPPRRRPPSQRSASLLALPPLPSPVNISVPSSLVRSLDGCKSTYRGA